MKIVVTGATGFIGSHFLKYALAGDDHNVLAIRRNPFSNPSITLPKQPLWLDRQLNEVTIDDLQGCDVLVHLATHTGNVPYDSLQNCIYWNCNAVLHLLETARIAEVSSFVIAGSCFEYGKSGNRFSHIPTDAPLEPSNSYAASKALATIAIRQWAEEHQVALEILRVFHGYGEGELSTRFWPSLRSAALEGRDFPMTKGEQLRDFQPVSSVARSFLDRALLVYRLSNYFNIFNLSSSSPLSIKEFAIQQWKLFDARGDLLLGKLPYRNSEVFSFLPGPNILELSNSL